MIVLKFNTLEVGEKMKNASVPLSADNNDSLNVNTEEIQDIDKEIDMPKRNTDNPMGEKKNRDNLRKPVKLTMKQGLLMNQVLSTYVMNDIKSPDCQKHIEEFKIGLRAFEPWALKMFDSSSKIQAGILYGNLMEYGAFDQCIAIYYNSESGPIQGKLCTLTIKPDTSLLKIIAGFNNVSERRFEKVKKSVIEASKLQWSVCVPNSCMAEDVLPHFNKTILELTQGISLSVMLRDKDCVSVTEKVEMNKIDYVLIVLLSSVILMVLVATCIDLLKKHEDLGWFVDAFSAYANTKRIFSKKSGPNELGCLHGLRFLSIAYVLFGHRYMASMIYPSANSFYLLEWILKYSSTVVIGGTVCVDTFLLISALLVSYNFLNYIEKHKTINLLTFYLYRYIRITIPLIPAIIWNAIGLKHLGSGPLWKDSLEAESANCRYYWWSAMLHIQPYVNPKNMCIVQTWYLSVDMLSFYLSPLILYPLWKWSTFGYLNYFVFYFASILSSFYVAWIREYEGSMPLTARLLENDYMQRHYFKPHTRCSPYIIGLGMGYILHKTMDTKQKMHYATLFAGWCISFSLMAAPIFGCHVFQEESHDYNRFESSIFLSCSRSGWVIGVCWMIWCCVNGYGGIINTILSSHPFRVLGRITYYIYLLHLNLQMLLEAERRSPGYFSNFNMIYLFSADMVTIGLLCFVFTVIFEYPVIALQKLMFANNKVSDNGKSLKK